MNSLYKNWSKIERDELEPEEKGDLIKAMRLRQNAFAPKSGYLAGAVIRMNDDRIYEGWNLEFEDYDLHAEVGAIARVLPKSREAGIHRIVLIGGGEGIDEEQIYFPCLDCRNKLRQLLAEGTSPDVILAGVQGKAWVGGFQEMFIK